MDKTEDSIKTILKGSILVFIGIFFSKLFSYFYKLIVARIGSEQYGLFSLSLSIMGIAVVLALLGLPDGIRRFIALYNSKEDKFRLKGIIHFSLKLTLPLSIVLSMVVFFLSKWVALTFFHDIRLSILIKILSLAIPLDVMGTVFLTSLIGFKKVGYMVYSKDIMENLVKVILTVLLVYFGLGVTGATIAYVIALAVSCTLGFYYLNKKVFPFLKTEIKAVYSNKKIIKYSLPLLLTNFVFMIVLWTDTLMLGYFRTASEVGVYNAAQPTAKLLYLFPSAFMILFLPVLTELYAKKNMKVFKSIYQTVTKWIFMTNTIILTLFLAFSRDILRILFTSEYISGWSVLIILSLGYFIAYLLSPAAEVLLTLKKTKWTFCNNFFMVIVNVILNYYLIPTYGIIGAAIATSVSFLARTIAVYIETFYLTKINPFKLSYLKVIASLIISFAITYPIALRFAYKNFYIMAIISILLLLIYFIMLLITKSFENEDLVVIRLIQKKLYTILRA